jgi:hypothetical protein
LWNSKITFHNSTESLWLLALWITTQRLIKSLSNCGHSYPMTCGVPKC